MAKPGLERLEINYYTVTIGALTGGAAPADGHVDPTTPEEYGALGAFPTTLALSLAKERANMRWEAILRQVSMEIQPLQISGVVATAADEDTPATGVDFTLAYDKDEYLRTEDENNLGTFLTSDAAIKRWVERAVATDHTFNRQIYDPTIVGNEPQIISVTAEKAEAAVDIAAITVAAVADVTDTI